ncbi:ATP-binding cassette domain-containing protein [Gluconobacter cerinus]|uniref:ATP-binding cassette domain-containing protein n=1 Tax=Gluconobacter cerinus TaxID=38307 RepID=UPI001B8CC61C|nr:ATP-binding cassette domain-containing protein [Gluconobacter cerinus]MBS1047565.1 ATP-binding cassette domain-containing protein [Gluconobacter cerinus]
MIEFRDVRKNYHVRGGINRVLRGADLLIRPGEKVGILGRNGAGKSTTIRLLSGSELPTSGTVERQMSVSWPLAFGGAFQGALTGRDNAKCISRIYGREIEDTLQFIQDFAELGLYFDEPVRTYSSGMAARLAFAISMSIEFDCFLIDEVVHVGDHKFHEKCQIELFEKRANRARVIVSHNEDFVREHCERAYVLKDGLFHSFEDVDEAIDFHINTLHGNTGSGDMSKLTVAGPRHDPNSIYVPHPATERRSDVPEGTQITLSIPPSSIFPDCRHEAWLYRPAGYDGNSALPLMVFQDGWWFKADDGPWQVPVVLNNLIADGLLPPTAVLFVEAGKPNQKHGLASEQRSFEYDSLTDHYVRFLDEEVFPEVRKHVTITDDPSQRAIGGFSSGGICAFTAAWQRPDVFGKVFSACGSFVDIRGGGAYPDIIMQSDPKPLRVFLQVGINAQLSGRFEGLDWPAGNRTMARALAFKGYDYQLVTGEGDLSHVHGASILPDVLQWLWR